MNYVRGPLTESKTEMFSFEFFFFLDILPGGNEPDCLQMSSCGRHRDLCPGDSPTCISPDTEQPLLNREAELCRDFRRPSGTAGGDQAVREGSYLGLSPWDRHSAFLEAAWIFIMTSLYPVQLCLFAIGCHLRPFYQWQQAKWVVYLLLAVRRKNSDIIFHSLK